jgi:hypothetical protein
VPNLAITRHNAWRVFYGNFHEMHSLCIPKLDFLVYEMVKGGPYWHVIRFLDHPLLPTNVRRDVPKIIKHGQLQQD